MKDFTVKHKTYGEGKVCAVGGTCVSVSFKDGVKKFSAERFFGYFTADAETTEALKREIASELEAERERGRQRAREAEEEKQEEERSFRRELLKKLKSYGFEGFLHTTEFENFRKIVGSGYLYSRAELKRKGLFFSDRAIGGIITRTESDIKRHARFYYRFGTPTNFDADYFRPVTLVFDENLIFDQDVLFSLGNAAVAAVHKTGSAEEALGFDWERVFRAGYPSDVDIRIRNAEFLYPEKVPVSRIAKVYFTCDAAKKEAESFCGAALRPKLVSDISKFEFLRREAR